MEKKQVEPACLSQHPAKIVQQTLPVLLLMRPGTAEISKSWSLNLPVIQPVSMKWCPVLRELFAYLEGSSHLPGFTSHTTSFSRKPSGTPASLPLCSFSSLLPLSIPGTHLVTVLSHLLSTRGSLKAGPDHL